MPEDLLVIVPSRERPKAAIELAEAFRDTNATAQLLLALDDNDPAVDDYFTAAHVYRNVRIHVGPSPTTMVRALNTAAGLYADVPYAIGFMGDDHRPRTGGWDTAYVDNLREMGTGIVFGNDLFQGSRLPTQVAMTADIVRTLGYMAPPTLTHLFVDNFWSELGGRADCIRYLPEVIVEHMHPMAGKAEWDDGYKRVNHQGMYVRDLEAYETFVNQRMTADVSAVRALKAAK